MIELKSSTWGVFDFAIKKYTISNKKKGKLYFPKALRDGDFFQNVINDIIPVLYRWVLRLKPFIR